MEIAFKEARILIVDDEVGNICLLQSILNRLGFKNLKSITDPRQTCDQLGKFQPDLIVLDINMPNLDGFGVMQQLGLFVPADAYLPVLVLTADVNPQTKRRALAAGATDLLHKPFDSSEILMRIRNLLKTRFLHLELQNQNVVLEQKVAERTAKLSSALKELKAAQGQLLQQERLHAFSEMAGGIVHDFNNALMSVIGYSDLLLQDPEMLGDRDTVIDYLKTMNTAGRDAAHVVSRLRDFYRPRDIADVFALLDLNKVIEECVALTQPKWKDQALAAGRTISVELDLEKLPLVNANAAEMREVIINLIFNAVDAMPVGGTITLRSRREDGHAVFEVGDTGTGMSEEVRSRCMEPFFTTKGEKGTGLGLSMVFGILKRHDAQLDIQSEHGHGTTFRIQLPGHTESIQATVAEIGRHERSLRVMVVDDEPVTRDVVAKYLAADGHQVTTASDGCDALEKFRREDFDLVLTDHGMPRMSGVELARLIRQTRAAQPVILLTGFEGLALDTTSPLVDSVVRKPVSQGELRQAIAGAVHTRNG